MNKEEFQNKINTIYIDGVKELESIGIYPSKNIEKVSVNTRAKKRLGCCKEKKRIGNSKYEIEISILLKDSSYDEIMTVMIHELLHSCKGCMNHGNIWKKYGKEVKEKLGYNITSRADYNNLKLEVKNPEYKYEIKCRRCGNKIYRSRKCNLVKNTANYRCGKCNGELHVTEL